MKEWIIACILILFLLFIFNIWAAYTGKNSCLENPAPRRWKESICEEYDGDQWQIIEINYFTSDFHYNDAAKGIEP